MSHPRFLFQQSVLFIDDQSQFENLIRKGLFSCAAEYEFCPSRVSKAYERLQGETPDLIVSTLDFKEGSVLDLFRKTNGYLQKIPALYLSEPHLADVEAEMSLMGKFNILDRKAGPLEIIRKMAQLVAENLNHEKPERFRPASGKAQLESLVVSEPALDSPWAEAILKKNK
jgi:DNA-binding NtrC family response regulator